jgi:hypothetical protein
MRNKNTPEGVPCRQVLPRGLCVKFLGMELNHSAINILSAVLREPR